MKKMHLIYQHGYLGYKIDHPNQEYDVDGDPMWEILNLCKTPPKKIPHKFQILKKIGKFDRAEIEKENKAYMEYHKNLDYSSFENLEATK